MGKTGFTLAALVLVLCQTAGARAADLGLPPPPPLEPMIAPAVSEPACCDQGWYFKGYLGTTNHDLDGLDNAAFDTADFTFYNMGFESSGFGGIGGGYKFNSHFRFDSTIEYRGKSTFHALDSYDGGGFTGTDDYEATLKSWVWMNSIYWDIVCWNGFTPYVGAGIGWARNTIGDYSDINVPTLGVAYALDNTVNNFAWSATAGVAFEVNNRVTFDLSYRYLNLGDAMSGTVTAYDGSGTADGLEFENVYSHDLMLGMRWKFGPGCCDQPAAMPIAFK